MSFWSRHQIFEKNSIILVVGILAVVAIGASLALGPMVIMFSAQLAWQLGFRSPLRWTTLPLLAPCLVLGLLLPLAYLTRRRLT